MKKIALFIVLLIICIAIGVFGVYRIYSEKSEVQQAEEVSAAYTDYSPAVSFDSTKTYEEIFCDFSEKLKNLKKISNNIVGWIYIPLTNIDYPVVKGEDNFYYLTHTPDGKYSAAGSIFVDTRGINENNTIIYGHNMGSSSNIMFHDITNFSQSEFFNNVQWGYFITDNAIVRLDIFAYSLTKPLSGFYSDNVALDFIKENSVNYREPAVKGTMYTLSTCAYDFDNARAVLSCVGEKVYVLNNK